jgi:uncharacterized membrane protein
VTDLVDRHFAQISRWKSKSEVVLERQRLSVSHSAISEGFALRAGVAQTQVVKPTPQRTDELTGVFMFIFINAFLIGTASGLRALIGLAAVSWAVHFGILPLGHTWLAFLGYAFTPYILTLMAIGELVNDKLPKTPSRLIPPQFITRIVMSALCGLAIGLSGNGMIIGLVAGIIGAVAGTFGGAKARSLLAKTFGRDLPAALLEDAVALGIAAFALFR